MRLNTLFEHTHPKYNKPTYLDEIYDAKDGIGRYKEIIKACREADGVETSSIVSENGKIYIFKTGRGSKKRLLLTSGLHGNECIGPKVSSMLLGLKKIPPEASVMVIPVLNPDGFIGTHRRGKKNNDPNRSFHNISTNELLDIIKRYDPTICVDLHEFHKNDGAFVYTNIPNIDRHITKIFDVSAMPMTKKNKINGSDVKTGIIMHGKENRNDGTLISWLDENGYKYILPESMSEGDPWSQITFMKLIIDLALSI